MPMNNTLNVYTKKKKNKLLPTAQPKEVADPSAVMDWPYSLRDRLSAFWGATKFGGRREFPTFAGGIHEWLLNAQQQPDGHLGGG